VGDKRQRIAVKKQSDKANTSPFQNALSKTRSTANTGHQVQNTGTLMEKIIHLPDIREDKVLHIQEMIRSGTYRIDSRKIARAMLRELSAWHRTEKEV
jgi:flagellar biosynthesis anti-sigma factor FlgM